MNSFNKLLIISICLSTPYLASEEKKPGNKKETSSSTVKEVENEKTNFQNSIPYNRNSYKNLPSPFEDLVIVERNRIKKELEQKRLKEEADAIRAGLTNTATEHQELPEDQKAKELIIIQEVRKGIETIQQLAEIRKYEEAEAKLTVLDTLLFKNNIERMREEIAKKRTEIVAEHKDWDDINKILNGLTVDAMFVAEGKKKVALINDVAVEEGDDLNELLNLSKESSILLTYVSSNSLKIKFKKFTLQKDLIDEDL